MRAFTFYGVTNWYFCQLFAHLIRKLPVKLFSRLAVDKNVVMLEIAGEDPQMVTMKSSGPIIVRMASGSQARNRSVPERSQVESRQSVA
ncbi:hypothetical protein ETA_25100 [Erwinia tasmaniensis Et1/99]|uniref:Uncharacterized protein n=1 Tax=Erwinia tasmaniensis (strain DSM 17950 / CFBP 7177 / CIP 109463 / NCPPB 4357 / Et1/99) TaxID=465817 RepID=B2VHT4_ERWT9|nr:hypothetical protein ETA_25100 [Erwinia tasmaniensis Et1/99]